MATEARAKAEMFRARLEKNRARLEGPFAREGTDCYRVYDHDIPELPFVVERWGPAHAVLTEVPGRHARTDAAHQAFVDEIAAVTAKALGIAPDHVLTKRRVRRVANTQWEKLDEARVELVVHERGLKFHVNLTDNVDTGLFLDHRSLRRQVESEVAGRSLLNLFCYTGAFTVAAARGGASSTLSVDLSNTALARLDENLRDNELGHPRHRLLRADCLAFLQAPVDERFDVIVLDPPSASKSKAATTDLDIQRDHGVLIERACARLAPGGTLYFSTNLRTFTLDERVARRTGLVEITKHTVPLDFRGTPHRTYVASTPAAR